MNDSSNEARTQLMNKNDQSITPKITLADDAEKPAATWRSRPTATRRPRPDPMRSQPWLPFEEEEVSR
jgi:hypothetical protein